MENTSANRKHSQVCKRMVGLAEKCVHPTSNKPYVKSHGGGRDNSPEGQQVVVAPIAIVHSHDSTDTRLIRALSRMVSFASLRARRTASTSKSSKRP
jgi:hypothetical protein